MRDLLLCAIRLRFYGRLAMGVIGLALPGWQSLIAQNEPAVSPADTVLAAEMLHAADSLGDAGDELAALENTRKALYLFEAAYGRNHLRTARTRMKLGIQLDDLYQIDSAIALYEQCLPFFESTGNPDLISWCHYQLGLSYRGIGQYDSAHQHLQTAIALVRPDSAAKAVRLASYKLGEASVFSAEKNYPAARALCASARDVYEQKNLLFNQALAAYRLAEIYFGLQDFQRALEEYLTAYHLLNTEQRLAAVYLTDLLVSIGLFYEKTGEPAQGLPYLERARTSCLEWCGPDSIQYARLLLAFGEFYLGAKQFAAAAENVEHSLAIEKRERRRPRERVFQVKTLEMLGDIYFEWGRWGQAETCYREILDIAGQYMSAHFHRQYQFELTVKLADIHCRAGDWGGSRALCDSAFAQCGFPGAPADQVFPRDYFRELCQVYGRNLDQAYRVSGDPAQLSRAEYFYSLAAQTLFREAAEMSSKSSKEILFDRDHQVLEQWLNARMELYRATGQRVHAEAAFRIAGQSKALLLYEARLQQWMSRNGGTPDSLLREEWSQQGRRIARLENELDSLRSAGSRVTDPATLSLETALVRQRGHADSLLQLLRRNCPNYFRMRYQTDTFSIAQWQQWLQPEQSILLYSLSDSVAYVFVLNRDTFCVRTLPIDFALDDTLQAYRESLTNYYTAAEPSDAQYDRTLGRFMALSQFLYKRLVKPVAPLLTGRVTVVPEGQLCYLPFETLLTDEPSDPANFRTFPFWLREKAISYCFSTDLLREMNADTDHKPPKTWLGIAPFSQAPGQRLALRDASRQMQFARLPYSGREVQSIRSVWGGDVWLGDAAKRSVFQKLAKQYQVLHLATHGRADEWNGDRSFVAFFDPDGQGLLTANALFACALPAEMIVLSACEAGSGKLHRGEGIIGLVRAFAWAGAKSIVASLWVADDASTADLMLEFYRRLLQGVPKDIALQQAQLKIWKDTPGKSHPFFWGGFRLYGRVTPLR